MRRPYLAPGDADEPDHDGSPVVGFDFHTRRAVTAPWEKKSNLQRPATADGGGTLRAQQRPAAPDDLGGGSDGSGGGDSSSWSMQSGSVNVAPRPVLGGVGAQESLSGMGDDFDAATGWNFAPVSRPDLDPVPWDAEIVEPPLASPEELFGPTGMEAGPQEPGAGASTAAPTALTSAVSLPSVAPVAPPPLRANRGTVAPSPTVRGLRIPTAAGIDSELSEAGRRIPADPAPRSSERIAAAPAPRSNERIAAAPGPRSSGRMATVVDDASEDEILTGGHAAVPTRAVTDVEGLLARGRELLSTNLNEEAVLVLRQAQRLAPGNTAIQTWREFGERRLMTQLCPGARPERIPVLTAPRLTFWDEAGPLERQLLVAMDGRRTIARLTQAAPDDKLTSLLTMLGDFERRGWLGWQD